MVLFLTREMGGGRVTSKWRNACEILLSQNGKIMYLRATGKGSHLYILTAYTDKNSPHYRIRFGLLLERKGEWELTRNKITRKGKYLLIDHLGRWIRIAVYGSFERARNNIAAVYDDVKMDVEQSYAGYASAACWRWLKDEVINFQLGMLYSSIYTKAGGLFYEEDKTNCFRLAVSLYLHLKLPYDMAKRVTTKKNDVYWLLNLWSSKELKDCWKYGISFYDDLERISRQHPKMTKTLKQIANQWRFTTGSNVDFARNLMKSLV